VDDAGGVRVAAGEEFEQLLLELVATRSPDGGESETETDVVSIPDINSSPLVSEAGRTILRSANMQALTAVGLMDGETIRGALVCLFRQPRQFDDGTVELHQALARQSALVLSRIRLQHQLESMALYDPLTRLANRNLLGQQLNRALDSARRTKHPLALVFVDLDGFKPVNDRFGHRVGDEVLQSVATRITGAIRSTDIAGRFGGDEFLIISEDIDLEQATTVAERVRNAILLPLDCVPEDLSISASIGIAHYQPDDGSPPPTSDPLVRAADAAMYEAKGRGGNQISSRQA
jgi:diguanylate cyclase (GGDEF)-like protein